MSVRSYKPEIDPKIQARIGSQCRARHFRQRRTQSWSRQLWEQSRRPTERPKITNNSKARIIRDGKVIYDGQIVSIFREKNAVKEVKNGLECGISLKDFIDFKEKDVIESYLSEEIQRSI